MPTPYTFFKTALRNIRRRKITSLINVGGLSIGITVCVAIFLIIRFENSFDTFHEKRAQIYRIITRFDGSDGIGYSSGVPVPLIRTLPEAFPQLPAVAGVYGDEQTQIQVLGNSGSIVKKFKENRGVFFTAPSFFSIFDFKWLHGEPEKCLSDPNTAVLSRSIAEKYFGSWQAAVGKTIMRNNQQVFKITGVLEDPPVNTDFQFKIIASYPTLNSYVSTDWTTVNSNTMCYFLMPKNLSPEQMDKMLVPFVKKHKPADRLSDGHIVQHLSKVHFDAESGNFLARTASVNVLNTLTLVGMFILLIACVNFINLSTAQSISRAKEVGIRKVLGGNQLQLRLQFLAEAGFVVTAAVALSLLLAWLLMPGIGKVLEIPVAFQFDATLAIFLMCCLVLVSLLSGLYPAFVLSGFNPVKALKAKIEAQSNKGINVRKSLVVLQFVIAQMLIIGTLVVIKQMQYFDTAALGFDKTSVITLPIPSDSAGRSKIDYLKQELKKDPMIQSVSFSFAAPSDDGNWYSDFKFDGSDKNSRFGTNMKLADSDYLTTYSIPLVAGRNYRQSDTANEVVVNEEFVRKLGLTDPGQVLNKKLDFWDGSVIVTVVGVMKDFHTTSLENPIAPVLAGTAKNTYRICNVKLNLSDATSTLSRIEQLWNAAYPSFVFEYRFLDETIANFYRQERQLAKLFRIFSCIAVLLSCLGLYGLASLLAVQKVKEVGIRKVLGATVSQIVMLFSKEFLLLVMVAFLIAAPIAYYFMTGWLQEFTYRTELSWWIFVAAGLLTMVIALATISVHSVKAALQDPVKNLRTE